MNTRPLQVGATMQRAIQNVLTRGLADPRIRGIITVTRVQVSPDLRGATVFVSVVPQEHEALALHGLKSASKHIRHEISDSLALRQTPQITFQLDEAYKAESHIHAVLNKAMRELETSNPSENPTTSDTSGDEA